MTATTDESMAANSVIKTLHVWSSQAALLRRSQSLALRLFGRVLFTGTHMFFSSSWKVASAASAFHEVDSNGDGLLTSGTHCGTSACNSRLILGRG